MYLQLLVGRYCRLLDVALVVLKSDEPSSERIQLPLFNQPFVFEKIK